MAQNDIDKGNEALCTIIVIGFMVKIRLLSSEVSADEHRTMYIGNFIVVDQVT